MEWVSTHPAAEAPETLFADAEAEVRWRARFTASRVSLPRWGHDAPDRNVYLSNSSGVWEVYAWDRATDIHRQVTDRPNGTSYARISPDGEHIWWFADTDGDEFGSWVREAFAGRPANSDPEEAVAGTMRGYPAGVELGRQTAVVGVSTDDGTKIFVSRDGAPAEVIYAHANDADVSALSRDERLLVIAHSEHGDNRHPALRVLAAAGGATVAEKWDGEGKGLTALDFSPVAGDPRLLVLHERRGKDEPLIWDVEADTGLEVAIALPGELAAARYPD